MRPKPANLLILIAAAIALVLVIINWSMLGAPVEVSFGFTHVSVPLGLVLLGFVLLLIALFFGLLLRVQFRLLATHRRHAAELRTQRELVDNAEASRFSELRVYLQQELAELKEAQRLSEQRLREELLTSSNSLSASVGEIDERLERHFPVSPDKQP